jgi:hypothetical protein
MERKGQFHPVVVIAAILCALNVPTPCVVYFTEALKCIRGLRGINIVGADIVCFVPHQFVGNNFRSLVDALTDNLSEFVLVLTCSIWTQSTRIFDC